MPWYVDRWSPHSVPHNKDFSVKLPQSSIIRSQILRSSPESDGILPMGCDPQENCTVRGPNYPCPTWRNPGKMCESYVDNPICQTRRAACRGQLASCVTAGLVAYGAGSACVSCVAAGAIASGYTGGAAALGAAAACVGVCGLSAGSLEQVINSCG